MKTSLLFGLLILSSQNFSCSRPPTNNSSSVANSNTARSPENSTAPTISNQFSKTPETPSGTQDVLITMDKDYIKRSGWTIPSLNETYLVKTDADKGITKEGKEVEVITNFYSYKTPKTYSEKFDYEGSKLELMKGSLRSGGFMEYSLNAKSFMFSIFVEKVVPPPASNSDPHLDPFVYQIMDADGDGIFETLRGDNHRIVVPSWVLK